MFPSPHDPTLSWLPPATRFRYEDPLMSPPEGGADTTGQRTVQRPLEDLPVLHLEAEIPRPADWFVSIDGLVDTPAAWDLDQIMSMGTDVRQWDLNCVWGWVKPNCEWEGVQAGRLIEAAGPRPAAGYVVVQAIEGPYASCLTLEEAKQSILAWQLDGVPLTPEHGGPLRLVTPPNKWGYKGVKWIGKMTVTEEFEPGFWEELVGKPHGDIPDDLLDHTFE